MICGIILSAGISKRMSHPKATLKLNNKKTFLENICDNLHSAGINERIVVLGPDYKQILKEWKYQNEKIVFNLLPESGTINSLKIALGMVAPDLFNAVLISHVDQPNIKVDTFIKLINCWKNNNFIIIPKFKNKKGHPIIISHHFFHQIKIAQSSQTLRDIITKNQNFVKLINIDDSAIIENINTPQDYQSLLKNR